MPLKYSVLELIQPPNTPACNAKNRYYNTELVYHVAPQDVAEAHEEGHFCVTSNSGDILTTWMKLHGPHAEQIAKTLKAVKSIGGPHKDVLQEDLAIGDYVMLAPNPAEMSIAKVLAFTPQKVRLLVYGRSYDVTAKNPSGLVKINPNILSD